MTSDGPTREEIARLYTTVDEGFRGIHARLDLLNGRTLKGEVSDAALTQRVTSVEKEVFSRRRIDRPLSTMGRRSLLTKRETGLVAAGVAILAALFKLTIILGDLAIEAFKMGLKKP